MAISTTRINGVLRNAFGQPYVGAVIRAYLSSPMEYSDNIIGTEVLTTHSNSYGQFHMDLVPTSFDQINSENYYVFEIIKDNTQVYKKLVPSSMVPLDFEDLTDYILPKQRTLYIGRDSTGRLTPEQIKVDILGTFRWITFDGDGFKNNFSAPGEVFIVSLNGVLIVEGIDYQKPDFDKIILDETPRSGDILGIQYKIVDENASIPAVPQVKVDVSGTFKWATFDGDGAIRQFSVPGDVYMVSLNGSLVFEGVDYQKLGSDTVLLDEPPKHGDILAIQYKI